MLRPILTPQFMQFMILPAFQQTIPTGNWMYPVIKSELTTGYHSLSVLENALQFTPAEVADHRATWIRTWQQAVSR